MGIAGHAPEGTVPYAMFDAALRAKNLTRVRRLAPMMEHGVSLADALRILALMVDQDGYERAAVRWLGRFATETPGVDLEALSAATAALDALPYSPEAMGQLVALLSPRP